MSEFGEVEIGVISVRDALSSGHVHVTQAFIRDPRLCKVSELLCCGGVTSVHTRTVWLPERASELYPT